MLDEHMPAWHLWGMGQLQSYLERNKIRQAAFAELVGTTQATISKLARGSIRPSLDLAFEIERATGGAVPAASWVLHSGNAAPSCTDMGGP